MGIQRPHGVEYCQYRYTDIGEDGHPHGAKPYRGKYEDCHFHTDGERHILMCDADGVAGYLDGKGYLLRGSRGQVLARTGT